MEYYYTILNSMISSIFNPVAQDYEDEHEGGGAGAMKRVKSQPWTLKQRSSLSEHLLRFSCIRRALCRKVSSNLIR